jgi:hypothetical protein
MTWVLYHAFKRLDVLSSSREAASTITTELPPHFKVRPKGANLKLAPLFPPMYMYTWMGLDHIFGQPHKRHSREGGNPEGRSWIPTFAGMTKWPKRRSSPVDVYVYSVLSVSVHYFAPAPPVMKCAALFPTLIPLLCHLMLLLLNLLPSPSPHHAPSPLLYHAPSPSPHHAPSPLPHHAPSGSFS